ncbi:MAG: hypothetical protein ABJO01_14710 [Parasphingorhabdus sp.]|uniref:hypothetical protein n=1 Tax=Parasphingorhabdus sp. TaxID=2709688 RepID=UPI003299F5BB
MGVSIDENLIFALFPIFFIGLWLGIVLLIAKTSGWSKLQDRFPDRHDMALLAMRSQSGIMGGAKMGKAKFSGCLKLDVCRTGLRVSVWKIFGPFQRPFFVPWSQIDISEDTFLRLKRYRFGFGTPEVGYLILGARTAQNIASQSPIEIT